MPAEIVMTAHDRDKLTELLSELSRGGQKLDVYAQNLRREIERTLIVDPRRMPPDVVTMYTRVRVNLSGRDMEIALVYPNEDDLRAMKLSVFSSVGTAIFGYREGDAVEWEVPDGTSRIHIRKIFYQPEAAGDHYARQYAGGKEVFPDFAGIKRR